MCESDHYAYLLLLVAQLGPTLADGLGNFTKLELGMILLYAVANLIHVELDAIISPKDQFQG